MIRILPYIIKTLPKSEEKEKPFVSAIEKPKPKKIKRQNAQLFFVK